MNLLSWKLYVDTVVIRTKDTIRKDEKFNKFMKKNKWGFKKEINKNSKSSYANDYRFFPKSDPNITLFHATFTKTSKGDNYTNWKFCGLVQYNDNDDDRIEALKILTEYFKDNGYEYIINQTDIAFDIFTDESMKKFLIIKKGKDKKITNPHVYVGEHESTHYIEKIIKEDNDEKAKEIMAKLLHRGEVNPDDFRDLRQHAYFYDKRIKDDLDFGILRFEVSFRKQYKSNKDIISTIKQGLACYVVFYFENIENCNKAKELYIDRLNKPTLKNMTETLKSEILNLGGMEINWGSLNEVINFIEDIIFKDNTITPNQSINTTKKDIDNKISFSIEHILLIISVIIAFIEVYCGQKKCEILNKSPP